MPNPKVRTLTIGGVTYDLQDNISGYITGITSSDVTTALGFTPYNATNPNGYTSNTGTITSVKTTAGAHTTINVSSGAANFNIPTKTSHLTNDSGFLTSYTETDPTVPSWAKASSKPSYELTEISGTDDLCVIEALTGTSGLLKKTAANTWTLDINTYLTSASTLDATKLSGTIPSGCYTDTNTTYSLSGSLASHKVTSTLTAGGSGSGTSTSDFTFAAGTGISLSDDTSTRTITITNTVTNTNTTYTLSNALTSHKFTSTLTAGGSGSGTSTATIEFVAGTGITLTDDTTNKKITIASSLTTFQSTTATLTTAGWSSKSQTVTVSGVTASNTVIVSPAPISYGEYSACGVYCNAQAANSLTFICSETPSDALTVNVLYK